MGNGQRLAAGDLASSALRFSMICWVSTANNQIMIVLSFPHWTALIHLIIRGKIKIELWGPFCFGKSSYVGVGIIDDRGVAPPRHFLYDRRWNLIAPHKSCFIIFIKKKKMTPTLLVIQTLINSFLINYKITIKSYINDMLTWIFACLRKKILYIYECI